MDTLRLLTLLCFFQIRKQKKTLSFYESQKDAGSLTLEFTITLGVLLILLVSGVEATSFFLNKKHITNLAGRLNLIVTQGNFKDQQLIPLLSITDTDPFPKDFPTQGKIIITGLKGGKDGTPEISWQQKSTGPFQAESKVGTTIGTPATLPQEVVLPKGKVIIFTEVFYNYELSFLMPTSFVLYSYAAAPLSTSKGGCNAQ